VRSRVDTVPISKQLIGDDRHIGFATTESLPDSGMQSLQPKSHLKRRATAPTTYAVAPALRKDTLMLLHVYHLFTIHDAHAADRFVRSLRLGGDWQRRARAIAPELIGTDLLRQQNAAADFLYLCLDLWSSAESYHGSLRLPGVQQLFNERRELVSSSFELGAFAFPPMSKPADEVLALTW
jgi:hypothetical protein